MTTSVTARARSATESGAAFTNCGLLPITETTFTAAEPIAVRPPVGSPQLGGESLDYRKISSYSFSDVAAQARSAAAARDRDPRRGAFYAPGGTRHLSRIRSRSDDAATARVSHLDRPRNALQGARPAGGVRSARLLLGGRGGGGRTTAPAALPAHRG